MIVTANPFLASFTVGNLKNWADLKMGAMVKPGASPEQYQGLEFR